MWQLTYFCHHMVYRNTTLRFFPWFIIHHWIIIIRLVLISGSRLKSDPLYLFMTYDDRFQNISIIVIWESLLWSALFISQVNKMGSLISCSRHMANDVVDHNTMLPALLDMSFLLAFELFSGRVVSVGAAFCFWCDAILWCADVLISCTYCRWSFIYQIMMYPAVSIRMIFSLLDCATVVFFCCHCNSFSSQPWGAEWPARNTQMCWCYLDSRLEQTWCLDTATFWFLSLPRRLRAPLQTSAGLIKSL